jgi:hypothetical protein
MKGEWVEIVVDTGAGEATHTWQVAATKAGRRVEIANRRGVIEVTEVTRTGTAIRTARFMASRVVAMVEHPANGQLSSGEAAAGRRGVVPPRGSAD